MVDVNDKGTRTKSYANSEIPLRAETRPPLPAGTAQITETALRQALVKTTTPTEAMTDHLATGMEVFDLASAGSLPLLLRYRRLRSLSAVTLNAPPMLRKALDELTAYRAAQANWASPVETDPD